MAQDIFGHISRAPALRGGIDISRVLAVRRKIRRDRIRGLTLIGLALIGLKVAAILVLGAHVYARKVAIYSQTGTSADRVIAWLIEPDAVTLAIAQSLRSLGL